MKTLLFINACIRGRQSRTWRIAAPLIEKLRTRYHVETIDVCALGWTAVGPDAFRDRGEGIFRHDVLNFAQMTAAADRIVIAAPFWDMSFPAALKVFFEQISLPGYTFDDGATRCIGRCRCEKVLYITTRGMDIRTGDPLEQAVPYLKALSFLWGLGEVTCLSCENMDYISEEEREARIRQAVTRGLILCEDF